MSKRRFILTIVSIIFWITAFIIILVNAIMRGYPTWIDIIALIADVLGLILDSTALYKYIKNK